MTVWNEAVAQAKSFVNREAPFRSFHDKVVCRVRSSIEAKRKQIS